MRVKNVAGWWSVGRLVGVGVLPCALGMLAAGALFTNASLPVPGRDFSAPWWPIASVLFSWPLLAAFRHSDSPMLWRSDVFRIAVRLQVVMVWAAVAVCAVLGARLISQFDLWVWLRNALLVLGPACFVVSNRTAASVACASLAMSLWLLGARPEGSEPVWWNLTATPVGAAWAKVVVALLVGVCAVMPRVGAARNGGRVLDRSHG